MRRFLIAWAALAALGSGCTRKAVMADEQAPEDPAVLVQLLGDPSFGKREAAQKALEALGEKAEPLLLEAAESEDAEVAARARQMLAAIRIAQIDFDLALDAEPKAGKDNPLRITVTNRGKEDVLLLKFLAGLFQPDSPGPTAFLEVADSEGREVPQSTLIRSRLQAALEADPYLELPAGRSQTFGPGEGFNALPLRVDRPGRYTVTLVYILREPFDIQRSLVDPRKEAERQQAQRTQDAGQVLLAEFRSKTLVVEVKE